MRLRLLIAALLLLPPVPCPAQQEYVLTIQTTLGDTTETFWLQIPRGYSPGVPTPLLIGWHQWGGDHLELKHATQFDSIADARNWIVASHQGVGSTHWNNPRTQSHVVDVIRWIEAHYSVDAARIYMVGSSMGGAAGMVFADNHLDPAGPMVAAAASVSGIQDCERRFHEQGINHSMIEAFGGTPEEVPHEYHRNSAVYFADSTWSMQRNARHLPLYLTFGHGVSDSIWRSHAEDLYSVLSGFADSVVKRESKLYGHGWGCVEEGRICDFLQSFQLDPYPARISINADEEGCWYWADLRMRRPEESFARFEGNADVAGARLEFGMLRNVSSAALDLRPLGFPLGHGAFSCQWDILDHGPASLAFKGVERIPSAVLRDGAAYEAWTYDPLTELLTLTGEGSGFYTVLFDPAAVEDGSGPSTPGAGPSDRVWPLRVWGGPGRDLHYRLRAAGRLSWELFDVSGRRLAGRDIGWRPAGSGTLTLETATPVGISFVSLRFEGTTSCSIRRKIPVLH